MIGYLSLMAKMNIAVEDGARVKLECIRLLTTLSLIKARMQLILGFVDTYLRLSEGEKRAYQTELKKLAPVEQERIMEVTMSWREEALQEGLRQVLEQGLRRGKEEGVREGAATVTLRQLERSLGPVEGRMREQIRSLAVEELEELGVALLDFSTLSELEEWLAGVQGHPIVGNETRTE